jgi:hypothetical protein
MSCCSFTKASEKCLISSTDRLEEDAIRRKAEELLARKKALLEEAARKQSAHVNAGDAARGRLVADATQRKTELVRGLAGMARGLFA